MSIFDALDNAVDRFLKTRVKYCHQCGGPLDTIEEVTPYYDENTGKLTKHIYRKRHCPKCNMDVLGPGAYEF